MAVDDLWYLKRRGPDGQRLPSKRHGRGMRWRVRYTDPDTGKPRESLWDKKVDAEREDANQRADISRGRWIDPRAGKVTVAEFAAAWREQQLHRDSTADLVERSFRIHIEPTLGALPLGNVRTSHLRGWVKHMDTATDLAASTIGLMFGYLSAMFATAVHDRIIAENPCRDVRLPEIDRGTRFIPTADQVHAVASALPDRYRPVPYLAAGCGLRQSEIMGMELPHVEFLRREVRVAQQLKYVTGRGRYIGPTKTTTSKRTVELPDIVSTALAKHL
ncbi:MAG TPA: site-specific integrase, partial [Micromonosporaceae bacterium]